MNRSLVNHYSFRAINSRDKLARNLAIRSATAKQAPRAQNTRASNRFDGAFHSWWRAIFSRWKIHVYAMTWTGGYGGSFRRNEILFFLREYSPNVYRSLTLLFWYTSWQIENIIQWRLKLIRVKIHKCKFIFSSIFFFFFCINLNRGVIRNTSIHDFAFN